LGPHTYALGNSPRLFKKELYFLEKLQTVFLHDERVGPLPDHDQPFGEGFLRLAKTVWAM